VKVFVSVDIEGVVGPTAWNEARWGDPEYRPHRDQMAREARAACEAALDAGATEILVKDAHGGARNLLPADLPRPARLVRGYNGHPFAMVQGLDETFDAVAFVGFHAAGGEAGNPLAHTISSRRLHRVRVDGEVMSETRLHAWAAGSVGVPVVAVCGDAALCAEVDGYGAGIRTVAVRDGEGASSTGLHPDEAVERIRSTVADALRADPRPTPLTPPGRCRLEIEYVDQAAAYARAWYPGAELVAPRVVALDVDGWFEALRALVFLGQ
jgi:D-amino peptidase